MLQRRLPFDTPVELPPRARRVLWTVTIMDVMAAAWMLSAGDWLDERSRVTAVVTLGGHHLVVLWLAVLAFAILAVLAPMTAGFAVASRPQLAALAVAGIVSTVALAGILSVSALVVGVVMLLAVLLRAVS